MRGVAEGRLLVNEDLRIPLSEFKITYARSAGPGGQNVNKVNSKAVLRWRIAASSAVPPQVRERFLARYGRRLSREGDLVLSSQRFREQRRNVEDCLSKLRRMLLSAAEPARPRRPTRPGRAAAERRLARKRTTARTKQLRGPVAAE
jgi:ribosome-associated protein